MDGWTALFCPMCLLKKKRRNCFAGERTWSRYAPDRRHPGRPCGRAQTQCRGQAIAPLFYTGLRRQKTARRLLGYDRVERDGEQK
jgi:hypothetical protein